MMLPRMHDSPMPMNTMLGSDSATATAPTEALLICPSVTEAHVSPPSVVFQRPPPVAPKYPTLGWPLTPLVAIERPPRSGPTLRHRYAFERTLSIGRSTRWRPRSAAGVRLKMVVTPASASDTEIAARAY